MSSRATCAEVRTLGPELALGMASGDERAAALDHLGSCTDCRRYVQQLASIADDMLLLGPEREPPVGFETKVLGLISETRRSRSLSRVLAVAAAVTALMFVSAAAVFAMHSDDRKMADSYRSALEEANGKYFGVVPLWSEGKDAGYLFGYQGEPSWFFMVVENEVDAGEYTAEVISTDGRSLPCGEFELSEDRTTWGRALPVPLHETAEVRVLDEAGRLAYVARFEH